MATILLDHNIQTYQDLETILSKSNKAMVVAATGAGKTSVALKYLEDHSLHGLVVCPQVSICRQWDAASDRVGTMTYQAFCNRPDVSNYDCYIFDEAHHTGASKWGAAVKDLMASTTKPILGLTADPKRYLDGGRDMGQELWDGNVVYGVDLDEAIQRGILPGGIFVCALFDAGAELEKYRNVSVTDTLKGRLDTSLENCLSIKDILYKHMPAGKRKGIVFTDCIDRIQESVALIQAIYPFEPVSYIHSECSQKHNITTLMEFNKAEHGFIVTVDMLNEGYHTPDVNTIIMLRRTSSPNVFMQQLGRGLTPSSKDVAIFDFVGNNCGLKLIEKHIKQTEGHVGITDSTGKKGEKKSSQFITFDYATPVLSVIRDIKAFLNGGWTEDEDNILRTNYSAMGTKVTVLLPERTTVACKHRARQLGIADSASSPWTKAEDDILRTNYPTIGAKVASLLPGRTTVACRLRARQLGLADSASSPWTKAEDDVLRANYPTMGGKVVSLLPGRTLYACMSRAHQLGVASLVLGLWTSAEDDILRTNYPIIGMNVSSLLPGRTASACMQRAFQLGITIQSSWTKAEDDILRANYPTMGTKAASMLPGRTASACQNRARQLGLKYHRL